MKKKEFLSVLLIFTLIFLLSSCNKSKNIDKDKEKNDDEEIEIIEDDEDEKEEDQDKDKENEEDNDNEKVDEDDEKDDKKDDEKDTSKEDLEGLKDKLGFDFSNPGTIGTWIESKANGKEMELGNIKYRITKLISDQKEIFEILKKYNSTDPLVIIDPAIDDTFYWKVFEYEVVYSEDFPGYGADGKNIPDPKLSFNITTKDGNGLDVSSGQSLVNLIVRDISNRIEGNQEIKAGDTFKGMAIYQIPNDPLEQYYLSTSFTLDNGDRLSTYVVPEEVNL